MRDTTSDRQVEGPAAVFSERGLAMFLDFVAAIATGRPGTTGGEFGTESEVNQFLANWVAFKAHKAAEGAQGGPEVQTPGRVSENAADGRRGRQRRDWGAEREALKSIMYGKGLLPLTRIYHEMRDDGFWNCEPKQASQQIKRIMQRFPGEIVDTRRGTYHWPAPDELVLKFREGDNDDEQTE